MGDSNRHRVFAQFVARNFPAAKTVIAVADGKGELAYALANMGMRVTVVENKPRGRKHRRIRYQKGWFDTSTEIDADLVVGMHPDEATLPIIQVARKNRVSFAVVPCCCVGPGSKGVTGYTQWLQRLKGFAGGCKETALRIRGKNIVLYS